MDVKMTVFTNEGKTMNVDVEKESFTANEFIAYFGEEISIEKLFHLANASSKLERRLILANPLNALYLGDIKWLTRKADLFGRLCSVVEYIYTVVTNRDDLVVYEDFLKELFTIKGDTAATNLLYKAIHEKSCPIEKAVRLWMQSERDTSALREKNLVAICEKLRLRKRVLENETINYSPFNYIKDTTVGGITFKCAPDTAALAEAECKLHISVYCCYAHRAVKNNVIVIGYKDGVPVMCLEVVGRALEQAKLEYCKDLGEKEIAIVKEWANINDIYACSCRDLHYKPLLLEGFDE